jgi:hypothetical protein
MKLIFIATSLFISFQAMSHTDESSLKKKLSFFPSELGFADQVATQYIKVVGGKMTGFTKTSKEKAKTLASYAIIEAVMNSETFKERVINFKNSQGQRSYTSNKGMTNEQIYEFLMSGKELIRGETTLGEMNFDVNRYSRWWSKVIGYTNPGKSNTIHVNGKFYSKYTLTQIASNITHEWIHLNGFYHDSARDHDSVPYAIGYIMESLAEQYVRDGYID